MFLALLLLICWPIAELFVAVKIADAIGVLPTLLLLIASWPVGSWALRSQGRAAWRRLGDAVAIGRSPGREALDGALILIGGLLMIVPGFITDGLALLLLMPTRALARRLLLRNRFVLRVTRPRGGRRPYDVDGTAIEIEQPRLQP